MNRISIQECHSRDILNKDFPKAMKSIRAEDIMTKPIHVLRADMDLIETVDFLASKSISGAPVIDHLGRIIGVVSEKDIITRMGSDHAGSSMEIISQCLKNKGCVAIPMHQLSVCDIMTSQVIAVTADVPIADITALLIENRINRLPIIENDRRPKGIVTRSDLLKFYCTLA